jgi:SpoVK/Ycf46/Vps4 family AAA+-type ATPase
MEVFEGIFICTTNRPDDLDPAALRRFDLKVEFRPLRKNQRLELVRQCCSALEIEFDPCDAAMDSSLRQLDGLTPGDAATALRHLAISGEPPTRRLLLEALETELRYKPKACRPVGFIH